MGEGVYGDQVGTRLMASSIDIEKIAKWKKVYTSLRNQWWNEMYTTLFQ
jgi:hypothetical protein